MNPQIIVIGAGVGGLSASLRLARAGARVCIVEKNPTVGGKLNLWSIPHPARPTDRPFRFDTGPSLLTMPFVFLDLFAAAGEDVRNHLTIRRLDPVARFQWGDGSSFSLRSDDVALHQEISRFAPGDSTGLARLLERGQRIWELSEDFLSHAPDELVRTAGANPLQMLALPFRIGLLAKFSRVIDKHVKNPRLRDVLYQYATYSGVSPFSAPATLTCIPWVEHYFGGWHIEGGMYRLAEQLEAVARRLGVEIRTNSPVKRILLEPLAPGRGKKSATARGVELADGTQLSADAVVVNADAIYAYRQFIPPVHRARYSDRKLDSLDPGGSGMIIMLGVDGEYPQLAHHTKFMPDDYRADLRAMFETRTIPRDPCIYVCAPTRTDPTLAPEGCETLFILVSAPPLSGSKIDWSIQGRRYRDQVVHALQSKWGLEDLTRRIVVERMMTPVDLKDVYNANRGSIYGMAGSSLRASMLRPANRDGQIEHLYFAGGAAHPGGGLPLVALSGKIAAELLAKDFNLAQPAPPKEDVP